ncbi:TPA: transglycosylase SLT domain-containing protein [Enterobacter hormaechei]
MSQKLTFLLCTIISMPFAEAKAPPRESLLWRNELIRISREIWGLNAPVADFSGQIHQESGWNTQARSPVGASGMAQFMPETARWISELYPELRDNAPYNPMWAIRALVQYDHRLWNSFQAKDNCQRMAFTLSAYNGGQGWVNKDKKLATSKGFDPSVWFEHVERVNAGRSTANWRENRQYPKTILFNKASLYLQWGPASCIS